MPDIEVRGVWLPTGSPDTAAGLSYLETTPTELLVERSELPALAGWVWGLPGSTEAVPWAGDEEISQVHVTLGGSSSGADAIRYLASLSADLRQRYLEAVASTAVRWMENLADVLSEGAGSYLDSWEALPTGRCFATGIDFSTAEPSAHVGYGDWLAFAAYVPDLASSAGVHALDRVHLSTSDPHPGFDG